MVGHSVQTLDNKNANDCNLICDTIKTDDIDVNQDDSFDLLGALEDSNQPSPNQESKPG